MLVREGAAAGLEHHLLHLLLLKKEPKWLMRKSRPIMLEASVIRQASSAMFGRIQCRGEVQQWFPAIFAYRRELSPQLVGVMARWLLAHWALARPV